MKPQVINFVPLRETTQSVLTSAYTFRHDRPMHWLQRACLFVLKKLQCHRIDQFFTIEKHVITDEKQMTLLRGLQRQGLEIDYLFHRKPKYLLIGPEEYTQLMDEPTSRFMWNFKITHQDFSGLTVHVIPWMSGVLVVPELGERI